jgi:small subunit ribosomal protein S13
LTYIYGIGRSVAVEILAKVGIEKTKKIDTLSEVELDKIRDEIKENYLVE